jgi:hypothetical protein
MKEETYNLTLKGLLSMTIEDPNEVKNTLDSIELYLRRHHSESGVPAIVFDDNEFYFTSVVGKND